MSTIELAGPLGIPGHVEPERWVERAVVQAIQRQRGERPPSPSMRWWATVRWYEDGATGRDV